MSSSLGSLLGDDALGRSTLALCQSALQPGSYKTYQSALQGFMEFCHEQNRPPLEVTPVDIARYIAWLGLQGTVAADSLQPYLSAINKFLQDHGREPVALGSLVGDVRKGLRNCQHDLTPKAVRVPLPAPVALSYLRLAEEMAPTLAWEDPACPKLYLFRALVAVVVNYSFFCRGECGVSLLSQDLVVDVSHITIFQRLSKGRKTIAAHRKPVLQLLVTSLPRVARILTIFSSGRAALAGACSWPLPSTFWALTPAEPAASWNASTLGAWLQASSQAVSQAPPPGFAWESHSLRKGAASAAFAIGARLEKIRYMGGWAKSSNVVTDHYIDFTMEPSPAAWLFFGHLCPSPIAMEPG